MAVYRKDHVAPYLQELEEFYWRLRRAVEGHEPNVDMADRYHTSPDQFSKEFTDIDMDRVERELRHFKASVDSLRQLRKKAMLRVHQP